jgi:RNA polymerase sigma factor (sigma-70 family)
MVVRGIDIKIAHQNEAHAKLTFGRISHNRPSPRSIAVSPGLPPFQRLIDAHGEDVWRMLVVSVGRHDAEDCYQETFISALRAYPRLRRDSNLRAWILTIAHRKALDVHRARARHAVPVATIDDVADRRHSHRSSPDPTHDEGLWQAVSELPDRQRSAVVLRFVSDLAHKDIATAIGCSEEAARRSLHEGLKTLRKEVVA